ncbi:23218_t:CDS:2 [Entrophospora sp. SA101]|nr:4999_t:CDS:2 [Entrophospora sp. SA101]CAJ0757948.1 23218_t:CDS:2 [Entrophospora sp. SA101]
MDVFNPSFEVYQCNAIYGCIRKISPTTEKTADDFIASATAECLPFEIVCVHGIITLLDVLVNEL